LAAGAQRGLGAGGPRKENLAIRLHDNGFGEVITVCHLECNGLYVAAEKFRSTSLKSGRKRTTAMSCC
jgi:hypothetical protein